MTSIATKPDSSPAIDDDELRRIDAYWRAADYLSVGQIYLFDNPLLKEPLCKEHIKPRLLDIIDSMFNQHVKWLKWHPTTKKTDHLTRTSLPSLPMC